MKKTTALIALLLAGFSMVGQDQVISKKSHPLKFQTGATEKLVSHHSNVLQYGNSTGHLSAKSSILAFGTSSRSQQAEVANVQPEKIKDPEVVPSVQSSVAASDRPIEMKTEPVVPVAILGAPAIASADRAVEIKSTATVGKELGEEYASALPRYHALVIGVSKYTYSGSGFESLENPAKDAKELCRVLTERYSFEKSDVTFLEDPTRHQIIDELELLSTKVGPKDNLLIFYAGHGYYDKQRELGYWLPSDARLTSKSEWIANSTVKDYLSTIRSKHTLLVTDACFGGSIFKTRSIDAYSMMKVYDLYKDPSRKAITSGNLTEVPDKSLFLEQLLKKLNDNPDDFLPAQKLFTRIYEPVTNNSSAIPKFGVIQGAGDEGGDFIFILRQK